MEKFDRAMVSLGTRYVMGTHSVGKQTLPTGKDCSNFVRLAYTRNLD
jgi:cell wall-associated NlpC family hydrolase